MTLITEPSAREQITTLLDRIRPDRYDPADHTWQAPVIAAVAGDITIEEARQIAAGRLVSNAEATATRRTNKLLRQIIETGALPLDWMDCLSWPLAIDDNERVALRAANADDLRRFANRERRAAANDFAARNESCEGALRLADLMAECGATVAADVDRLLLGEAGAA